MNSFRERYCSEIEYCLQDEAEDEARLPKIIDGLLKNFRASCKLHRQFISKFPVENGFTDSNEANIGNSIFKVSRHKIYTNLFLISGSKAWFLFVLRQVNWLKGIFDQLGDKEFNVAIFDQRTSISTLYEDIKKDMSEAYP